MNTIEKRMRVYQFTAIFSILLALVGFSYNVWRLETLEQNNSRRTVSFEILIILGELEQLVYATHYDRERAASNPRIGWVEVGLIADLSSLASPLAQRRATVLRQVWQDNWTALPANRESADALIAAIGHVRNEITRLLVTPK